MCHVLDRLCLALKPVLKTPNLSDSFMESAPLAVACFSKDSSFEIQKSDAFYFFVENWQYLL